MFATLATAFLSYAVWLYYRFCLSYRDVEELLAQRGITGSYESIRRWCHKFGQSYANQLKRRFARAGDKWYLDEVRIVLTVKCIGCGEQLSITVESWISGAKATE